MQEPDVFVHRLLRANQDHLAAVLEHGSAEDKASLRRQLETALPDVDFNHLNDALRDSLSVVDGGSHSVIEPLPHELIFDVREKKKGHPRTFGVVDRIGQLEALGYEAINSGRVAFLILAGGSGTRLGEIAPKGLFTCSGMLQKKSLFQIHCEKLRRREELAASRCGGAPSPKIQLLVMTSAQNDASTRRFFQENAYFGLVEEQVHFFQQGSLPCYDRATGKILMETSGRMYLAPCGNGAVYSALTSVQTDRGEEESVLQRIQRLGVEYVQTGNVDNMLAKVADPLFVGYAISEQAHVVVKAASKNYVEEPVGVFARVDGEWGVVEYTEIGARASETDPQTGELRFKQANISCHVCTTRFLQVASERMKTHLRYHVACKNIITVNGPVMGVKLEAFIFDFFRFAKECNDPPVGGKEFCVMQVERNEEFAPVKNADGATNDTPRQATELTLALHTRWLTAALGAAASGDGSVDANAAEAALHILQSKSISAEISPLVSIEGEGLSPYLPRVVHQLLCESSSRILIERHDELSNI